MVFQSFVTTINNALMLQMKNSAEILAYLYSNRPKSPEAISYSFLVPNIKGLQNALAVSATRPNFSEVAKSSATITPPQTPPADGDLHGSHFTEIPKELKLDEISVFAAATETFSRKNLNCSISESLERFKPVIALATSKDIRVRAYISVVLGCPYEGQNVSSGHVVDLSAELLRMGADEISLGDTTGMGTAPRTSALLRILKRVVPIDKIAMHFHDTYGQALVNTEVAVTEGIRTFDSSVSGLGGCPYAKGATGNVATEDLVYFMHSIGLDTGVDIERMADIGSWISKELGRENGSRVGKALLAKRR